MAWIEHGERACELCGRLVGTGSELKQHMRDEHDRDITPVDFEGRSSEPRSRADAVADEETVDEPDTPRRQGQLPTR